MINHVHDVHILLLTRFYSCPTIHRGKDFRPCFGRLGELRCLVPPKVNLIAMTAANRRTRLTVMKKLMMESALVVDVSPEKPNIFLGAVGATSVEKLADDFVWAYTSMGSTTRRL